MIDKQDIKPACECIICGEEIYPGEIVWSTDEGPVHMDRVCVQAYIDDRYLYSDDAASDLMTLLRIPTEAAG